MARSNLGGLMRAVLIIASLTTAVASTLSAQELVAPRSARIDAPFEIRVEGASPGASVLLRMTSPDAQGRTWSAEAVFIADSGGSVALNTDAPAEGSYRGVDPMGLVTTMELSGVEDARFAPSPLGTASLQLTMLIDGASMDSVTIERSIVPDGVRQISVGPPSGVVGTLFLPTEPPKGGLLVLGGSEGGNSGASLAALLAGHGFAALSVAYFGAPGVPAALQRVPLEYFSEAIDQLRSQPGLENAPVAIVGTSKGAEAALLVATRDPRVTAVVAYAPSSVAWSCICQDSEDSSWTWNGEDVPSVGPGSDPDHATVPGEPITPAVHYRYRMRHESDIDAAQIPVDRIGGPIMIVAGEADALWPSGEMSREIQYRRAGAPHSAQDVFLTYPGAGHLIGKMYLPGGSTRVARGRIETGGSSRANALAQADAWPQVIEFLEQAVAASQGTARSHGNDPPSTERP